MKRLLPGFAILLLATLCLLMGCEELDPECAWLVLDFSDCPTVLINCPDSPYYGPVTGDPGTNGYNLVAATIPALAAALLTADTTVSVSNIVAAHVIFAGLFLAYLPFTPMMHFVAKYFTYHQIRWDDQPLRENPKMQEEIQELLGQPVSWAGKHLGADGNKNWVDIATSTGSEEKGQ